MLANSDFTRGLLLDLGVEQNRIAVVAGGVDAARFQRPDVHKAAWRSALGLPADAFVLLTACRFVAKKGLDLVLHALQALRSDLPAHLVVVSDGRDRPIYQALAAEPELSRHVTFPGHIKHGLIEHYF